MVGGRAVQAALAVVGMVRGCAGAEGLVEAAHSVAAVVKAGSVKRAEETARGIRRR